MTVTTTDENGKTNLAANAIAHALLGAALAEASGNSAAAVAAGAVSGELAARALSKALYGGKSASELTEAEKQELSTLATVAGGLAAGLVRIPLYSITDWHRSSISDSHPFDQPGT